MAIVRKLGDFLKIAGEARDAILVGATCIYAFGFIVWSLHAWRHGLGFLPIANSQYFIAGLPVLFTLVAGYSLVQSRHWLREWVLRNGPRRTRIVGLLTLTAMVVSVLLETLVGHIARTAWSIAAWEVFVVFKLVVFILFLTLVLLTSELRRHANNSGEVLDWLLKGSIVVSTLLVAWALFTLVDQYFPLLPQEFGGGKPRLAVLHVRVSDLSRSLRDTLLAEPDDQEAETRASKEVLVFYADTDRLIVKVRPEVMGGSAADVLAAPAYELPTDAIRATTYVQSRH